MQYFITGATGFLGSHIAETLVENSQEVVALARPESDTTFLERLGVTIERGDFGDPEVLHRVLPSAEAVIHCAAKVGDWGPVEDYRQVNVEGLRRFLEACKGLALFRFLYISSLGVYATKHHHGTDETEPLPKSHVDGYTQSKVEAEQLALKYYQDFGVPVVILRPGFIYGPRDRHLIPRILEGLRLETIRYPGAKGYRALNTIYVGNLVQAVLLALQREEAVGQIFNLTDGEYVSKRQFVEAIANQMELPCPTRTLPLWLARWITWWTETWAKATGAKTAPMFTQARLKFMGYNLDFSIDKAKMELGYLPRYSFEDAIYLTMRWFKEQEAKGQSDPDAPPGIVKPQETS
ncbi:MAG: NAD-dependent epimerase/dehydratase family protein [Gemmataceae bacterium]